MTALSRTHGTFGRSSTFVMLAAISLVAAADFLFYRHLFGWTAGLFTLGVLLALVVRPAGARSRKAKWTITLAVFGLALTLMEEPTPLALSVTSVAIIVLAITVRDGWTISSRIWLERGGKFLLAGWLRILPDSLLSLKSAQRRPAAGQGGPAAAFWTLGKWIIPLLLGSGFVALFAVANPVVEDFVMRSAAWVSRQFAELPGLLDPMRILFWAAVLAGVWGLLRVRTRRWSASRKTRFPARPTLAPLPTDVMPGSTTQYAPPRTIIPVDRHALIERCLIVFNIIFAIESALDVFYLWGGRQLPRGLTFKEYAHRGSYPLIATALLAAMFVLIAFGRDANTQSWRKARLLVYVWIIQNVLLTFSAGWRLMLLVNASNLTRWRLATTIWLALVAVGLISIVWRIVTHRDNAALLRANVAMTALVLYACCFVNLDGFIANYNADHCMEVARRGDVLGLTYLRDLGIEAIPALDRLSHTLDTPGRRAMAAGFAADLRKQVDEQLKDWRGWTWRRLRLHGSSAHA